MLQLKKYKGSLIGDTKKDDKKWRIKFAFELYQM